MIQIASNNAINKKRQNAYATLFAVVGFPLTSCGLKIFTRSVNKCVNFREANMNYNIASSTNGFKQFVYNPETRAFLGRTAKSWAKISGAYACLYTFLGGFFLALLSIALSTTSIEKPKWTLDDGLIGVTPGIGNN